MASSMLLNLKIIIITLVLGIDRVRSQGLFSIQGFVNIVDADIKEAIPAHCSGALTGPQWAVTSAKCIKHLNSTKLLVTAAYIQNKGPQQTREVAKTYVNTKHGDNIILLKLRSPFNRTKNLDFYRLPDPKFQMCKTPQSLRFETKKANETVSRLVIGFLLGIIIWDDNKKVNTPPPDPYPPDHDDDDDDDDYDDDDDDDDYDDDDYDDDDRDRDRDRDDDDDDSEYDDYDDDYDDDDYGHAEKKRKRKRNRRYFKSSRLLTILRPNQTECKQPPTGSPLLCDDVIIGVETGCKPLSGGVELQFSSIFHAMPFILKSANPKHEHPKHERGTTKKPSDKKNEARALYQKNYNIWKEILLAMTILAYVL